MAPISRRAFFVASVGIAGSMLPWPDACASNSSNSPLTTRGVVLLPSDLSLKDWPLRAEQAGLSTIGIHHQHSPAGVVQWIESDAGQRFLEQCEKLNLDIEYELHALNELLPRNLFEVSPEFFRMNDKGERTPDANCCVHSKEGLELVCENALKIAETLQPTTNRYFYWGDDGAPWCQCPKCEELSASEQALMVENRLLKALRSRNPKACLAHLAYWNTLTPPKLVAPAEGIFLEYAPIRRRYDVPYKQQQGSETQDGLSWLDANLEVFPASTAQVLEYWLDVSRFSDWKRPAQKLPWNEDVVRTDIETYRKRGIQHVTTFAAWVDAKYNERFGNLDFIMEYGRALSDS